MTVNSAPNPTKQGLGARVPGRHGNQLHDLLVHDIGRRIVAGELRAGQLIVPQQLCAQYGVSSTVVREALRVVGSRGLLEARRKAGTRVTDRSHWDFLDQMIIGWRLAGAEGADQVRELVELRQAVEPLAVRLVVANPDPELIRKLTDAVQQMAGAMASGDVHRLTEADVSFHAAIFDHAGSELLTRLSSVISASLQVRETLHLPITDYTRHGLDNHALLVSQIAAGNASAEQTIREIVDEFDHEHAGIPMDHTAPTTN